MPLQIKIDIEKGSGLFLKQEMGTGKIGDEPLSFGIGLPTGVPYVHLRGEYYHVPEIFQLMLRAVHEQEGCETHPAPCDEHEAQPASTPERVAQVARAHRDA